MITSLKSANEFTIQQIEKMTKETLDETEKGILEVLLENAFFEKIEWLVTEQEIEEKKLENEDALDAYLFHKIPNYTTLLEESTTEVITDYLVTEEIEN